MCLKDGIIIFQMLDCNEGQVLNLISQHPKDEQKFVVIEKTMAHIKTFEGTYCFISICGDYRSGKSFLLNSLFFNYSGFETSSTTTSCTKGIKIWSVPIERNGIYIWIIDTEGFGSIEKDSTYDGKIFLMNFLISNIVLYNSFGAIDQNNINKLSMICRQARNLDQSIIESKLFWVLRDFSLEMIDKAGKTLSSDEYLEECLKENTSNQNKSEKEFLRNLFKQRHCVALIRPLIDESKLNNLKELNKINIREEFKQEISKLYEDLMQASDPKMINGIKIGSHNIEILVGEFVGTINKGTIDCNLNCTYERIMQYEQMMKKQSILSNLNTKIESLRKILPVQKHHITYLRQQITETLSIQLRQLQKYSNRASMQLIAIETNNEVKLAIESIEKENRQKLAQEIKQYLYRQLIQLYPKLIVLGHQNFQSKFTQIFSKLKEEYIVKYSPYLSEQPFLEVNYNQFIEKQERKVFFELVKRWRGAQKDSEEKGEELKKSKRLLEDEVKKLKEEKAKFMRILQDSKKEQAKNLQQMKEDVQETFKQEARLIAREYQSKIHEITNNHEQQLAKLKLALQTLQEQKFKIKTEIQYEKQILLEKIALQKQRAQFLNMKWEQAKNSIEIEQQQRRISFDNKLKIAEAKYNELQNALNNQRKKYQMISDERRIEESRLLQELSQKNFKIESLTEELIYLEQKYKQELERILMEEKDILCKTLSSKMNENQYKCKIYESKLQELAITAEEKEFYEQRSEELELEMRELKTILDQEQDKAAALSNRIKKYENELEEKQNALKIQREEHQKELNLLNENLLNSKNFIKEAELRHNEQLDMYKTKLQMSLKEQSSTLNTKYEQTLDNYRALLQQKFDKERSQLKEIIKNNYDEIENLKITIITLNSQLEKIYEILARIFQDFQHFRNLSKHENENPMRTSRCNSYNLTDIAESPEEYSDKMNSASKNQKLFKSTHFIAQEIEEMFAGMKEEIVFLGKQRLSISELLKSKIEEQESYSRTASKAKQENKNYRTEVQELRKRLSQFEGISKQCNLFKEKAEIVQKQNAQLRREIDLKEQLSLTRQQNFKQNSIMYKDTISNLTDQMKMLTLKVRELTESNETYESELERFKIWATEVKSKSTISLHPEELEMSAEKIKDLENQIKKLARKLQETKMQKLQKTSKKEINLYSTMLHENRISQIEALRAENEQLYRKLEEKHETQMKTLEQKKQAKQRQTQHEQSRYSSLKEEHENYKKRSKESISILQSKIQIYEEENKQLKEEYIELENNITQKYEFNKRIMEQQIEELKREKQSLTEFYNKKIQNLQEGLNSKAYDADKRIAEADLRFEQYRDQLQKQHNRIILQGERHRLKYEHLLKVNGQLIKQIESLKSKAHQMTIKQKYKSKISSLFDD